MPERPRRRRWLIGALSVTAAVALTSAVVAARRAPTALDRLGSPREIQILVDDEGLRTEVTTVRALWRLGRGFLVGGARSTRERRLLPQLWWLDERGEATTLGNLSLPEGYSQGLVEAVGRESAASVEVVGRVFKGNSSAIAVWDVTLARANTAPRLVVPSDGVGFGPVRAVDDGRTTFILVTDHDTTMGLLKLLRMDPQHARMLWSINRASLPPRMLLGWTSGVIVIAASDVSGEAGARQRLLAIDASTGRSLPIKTDFTYAASYELLLPTRNGFAVILRRPASGPLNWLQFQRGPGVFQPAGDGFLEDSGEEGDSDADLASQYDVLDSSVAADKPDTVFAVLRSRWSGTTELAVIERSTYAFWTLRRLQTIQQPCSRPFDETQEVEGAQLASLSTALAFTCRTGQGHQSFPAVLNDLNTTGAVSGFTYDKTPKAYPVDVRFEAAADYVILAHRNVTSLPTRVPAMLTSVRGGNNRTSDLGVELSDDVLGARFGVLMPTLDRAWFYKLGFSSEPPFQYGLAKREALTSPTSASTSTSMQPPEEDGANEPDADAPRSSTHWVARIQPAPGRLLQWARSDSGRTAAVNVVGHGGQRTAYLLLDDGLSQNPRVWALGGLWPLTAREVCDSGQNIVIAGEESGRPAVWLASASRSAPGSQRSIMRLSDVEALFAGGEIRGCSVRGDRVVVAGADGEGRGQVVVTAMSQGAARRRFTTGPCQRAEDAAAFGQRIVLAVSSMCSPVAHQVEVWSADGERRRSVSLDQGMTRLDLVRVGPDGRHVVVIGDYLDWPRILELAPEP